MPSENIGILIISLALTAIVLFPMVCFLKKMESPTANNTTQCRLKPLVLDADNKSLVESLKLSERNIILTISFAVFACPLWAELVIPNMVENPIVALVANACFNRAVFSAFSPLVLFLLLLL